MGQAYDVNDFNARVKRIKSPRNNAYYDPALQMHVPKRTNQKEIRRAVKARRFPPGRVLICIVIGIVAVVIAQGLRVRYLGLVETGSVALFADLLFSLFFLLLIAALTGNRRLPHRLLQLVGATAMIVAGHNLMWFFPEEMAIVYTTEYVALIQEQTEPRTLVLQDYSISF